MSDLTRILERVGRREAGASDELASEIYEELREMARREMERERPDHTLQPTALVNEAFLRLFPEQEVSFENRAHFFGAAATAIRRILVEHARGRARVKRDRRRVAWVPDEHALTRPVQDDQLLELNDAVEALVAHSPDLARMVELRFFGGLSTAEVAMAMSVSEATVTRRWRVARAWLAARLGGADGA